MLVEIKDLKPGDEIITLAQCPKYLRVVELPRESKKTTWHGDQRFIAVRCQSKVGISVVNRYIWDRNLRKSILTPTQIEDHLIESPDEDSPVKRFDLNGKKLWLVKRKQQM